jgi:hypothetical protein
MDGSKAHGPVQSLVTSFSGLALARFRCSLWGPGGGLAVRCSAEARLWFDARQRLGSGVSARQPRAAPVSMFRPSSAPSRCRRLPVGCGVEVMDELAHERRHSRGNAAVMRCRREGERSRRPCLAERSARFVEGQESRAQAWPAWLGREGRMPAKRGAPVTAGVMSAASRGMAIVGPAVWRRVRPERPFPLSAQSPRRAPRADAPQTMPGEPPAARPTELSAAGRRTSAGTAPRSPRARHPTDTACPSP